MRLSDGPPLFLHQQMYRLPDNKTVLAVSVLRVDSYDVRSDHARFKIYREEHYICRRRLNLLTVAF